jgi:hypothetical protein
MRHFLRWLREGGVRPTDQGLAEEKSTAVRLVPMIPQPKQPLSDTAFELHVEDSSGWLPSVSMAPPPPPPPTPGLGRPETTRREARWERAITWLLSRGER